MLVCGSGDVVHNLRLIDGAGGDPSLWASGFHERVKALLAAHDDGPLVDYPSLGEPAALSIPTPEHYLPLLYLLGMRGEDEGVSFFNDAIDLGAISMLGALFGSLPEGRSPMEENVPPVTGIA